MFFTGGKMFKVGDKVRLKQLTDEEFEAFDRELGEFKWHDRYIDLDVLGQIVKKEDSAYLVHFPTGKCCWFTEWSLLESREVNVEFKTVKVIASCYNCARFSTKKSKCYTYDLEIIKPLAVKCIDYEKKIFS
jgi:DNA-dependent RNA polymerase auxiliary subunit epsilon